jgi:acylphosphatase
MGVNGWVRNCHDGRVEAVFEGDEPAVEHMISWCWQGPVRAHVTGVQVATEPTESLISFSVRGGD